MTTRWKIVLEYDGTHYHGWQIQPDVPTIQGAVEQALHKFTQTKIDVTAAGRTDAGVHAWAQVAHFDLAKDYEPHVVQNAINAHLRPQPIVVVHAEPVTDDFHARFGAKIKTYDYKIIHRNVFPSIDAGRYWHVRQCLDIDAMNDAARVLIGRHDFSTFRDSECQANSPIRTLDSLTVTQEPYDDYRGTKITIRAVAQSFLHHQVRNIAGALKLVGQGKWSAQDLQNALDAKDRTKGGPTAPAQGLYLNTIEYD